MPPALHASTPAIASYAGKGTVKCGKNVADPGMKLVTSPRSTDPMIYRARRMPRLEIRPSGRTPGGIFHLHEGGPEWSRTWTRTRAVPEILRWRTQFFGQIFLGKILEIKIVLLSIPEERVLRVGRSDSARSDSGPGTHYLPRATPQRL